METLMYTRARTQALSSAKRRAAARVVFACFLVRRSVFVYVLLIGDVYARVHIMIYAYTRGLLMCSLNN